MTKTSKQFSKTGLTLAILLAAFDGEGRAQETLIEQQCAVNCANIFNTTLSCLATNSCQTAIANLETCINVTHTSTCAPPPPVPPAKQQSFTTIVYQSCAIDCYTTFNTTFSACAATDQMCKPKAVGALSTCLTGINSQSDCVPAAR